MNFIDYKKPIVPLSSVAEMLDVKVRTLRIYEEKGLLPKYVNTTKKLYALEDIPKIAYVHYLANHKKINANGIKYIIDLLHENMSDKEVDVIMSVVEEKFQAPTFEEKESDEIEEIL